MALAPRIRGLTGAYATRRKPKTGSIRLPSYVGNTNTTGTYQRGPVTVRDVTNPKGPPTVLGAPGAQAPPVDPALDEQIAAATRRRDLRLGALDYQQGQLGQTYGLSVNPQGIVIDDPTNPFSRAAAIQQAYDRSRRGASAGYAARGLLYSGALQNAQNENARVNTRDRDALVRAFLGARADIEQQRLGAGADFDDAAARARGDALTRALQARPDAASVPPAASPAAPAAPRRPPVSKIRPRARPKKRGR